MKLPDQITAMDDSQVLKLFRDFSQHVLNNVQLSFQELHDHLPPAIAALPDIQKLTQVEPLELLATIEHQEAIRVARATLMALAIDPLWSGLLDQYASGYLDKELSAGTVIKVVTPILMILMLTSLKVEVKSDRTWSASFGSHNISDNSIKLVKTLLATFPESLSKLVK